MAIFDQREQKVNYQYNAAGNINLGEVQNQKDIAAELQKLLQEIENAVESGALDKEVAVDVKATLEKAILQAEKPAPDKKTIADYLKEAKDFMENIAAVSGIVAGLTKAIEVVGRYF